MPSPCPLLLPGLLLTYLILLSKMFLISFISFLFFPPPFPLHSFSYSVIHFLLCFFLIVSTYDSFLSLIPKVVGDKISFGRQRFNKNLLYEATTILFAGQDTSAATLSWTLHLLSMYPKIQNKLAKEVLETLNEDEDFSKIGDHRITKKTISKLSYLDAVVKESMRLYPGAPFIVRRLQEDVSIATENMYSSIGVQNNKKVVY